MGRPRFPGSLEAVERSDGVVDAVHTDGGPHGADGGGETGEVAGVVCEGGFVEGGLVVAVGAGDAHCRVVRHADSSALGCVVQGDDGVSLARPRRALEGVEALEELGELGPVASFDAGQEVGDVGEGFDRGVQGCEDQVSDVAVGDHFGVWSDHGKRVVV